MRLKQKQGKVIIKRINNASTNSLIPIIDKNVAKNTIVYTDGWSSYQKINMNTMENV